MGYIYCLVGKSGTGKDTVMEQILADKDLKIEKIVPYTTRPKRENEIEGVNYHYVDILKMEQMEREGLIIERRSYDTVHGIWNYFTADKDIDRQKDYIIITTQEALERFVEKFGQDNIYVIYLQLDDRVRLERCIAREAMQENPNYKEVCRRFLTDENDFDEYALRNFKNCMFVDTISTFDACDRIKKEIKNNG